MHIDEKNNWLPHLRNFPKSIRGYKSCVYFLALEGWRRGLTLRFHLRPSNFISSGISYSLSDGEKTHYFKVSRGDKVTKEAISICVQKPKTYEYLRKNNIPVPEGRDFSKTATDEEIIAYAEKIGYPLVVKPTDGASGKGVIVDIKNITELKDAIQTVRYELKYKDVIVERFIRGMDYRVYVVDGEVIGIYKRVPANVIGDGISTIEQLIEIKNNIRKKNPFIQRRSIKIDDNLIDYLEEQNLSLQSVPEKGERIFLRRQGEYLQERDPVDITEEVPEHIKEIAVKAVKSIPGLPHCNVDMLVDEEREEGFVNEINSRPQISNHLFPLEGKARDIPRAIIDFYFPETKNKERYDQYYFDFDSVYRSFINRDASLIEIPAVPKTHQLIRFRLNGDLQKKVYETRIRRQFATLKIYGYLKHLKNGQTSIVASGTSKALEKLERWLKDEFLETEKVKSIKKLSRKRPIVLSFNVYSSRKRKSKLREENENLKKKLQKVTKDYKMLSSKLPIRLYRKIMRVGRNNS